MKILHDNRSNLLIIQVKKFLKKLTWWSIINTIQPMFSIIEFRIFTALIVPHTITFAILTNQKQDKVYQVVHLHLAQTFYSSLLFQVVIVICPEASTQE